MPGAELKYSIVLGVEASVTPQPVVPEVVISVLVLAGLKNGPVGVPEITCKVLPAVGA